LFENCNKLGIQRGLFKQVLSATEMIKLETPMGH
jgi:hypothetical protein